MCVKGEATVLDTSNADFEVKGQLLVNAPNGSEAWAVNSVQNITWTRTGSIANVKLEYSSDSGANYSGLIIASTSGAGLS